MCKLYSGRTLIAIVGVVLSPMNCIIAISYSYLVLFTHQDWRTVDISKIGSNLIFYFEKKKGGGEGGELQLPHYTHTPCQNLPPSNMVPSVLIFQLVK